MSEIEQAIDEAMAEIEKPKMKRMPQAKPLSLADLFFVCVIVFGLPLIIYFAGGHVDVNVADLLDF